MTPWTTKTSSPAALEPEPLPPLTGVHLRILANS